jgi:hypothetical protein
MKYRFAGIASLILMTGMILPGAGPAGPSCDGAVPPYPLIAVDPPGYSSFSGILEMAPVSESYGVAFGGNKALSGAVTSLSAFQVGKSGIAGYSKAFAAGMGEVCAVSADWITYFGSGYGLVFVMFVTVHAKPEWSALSLRVAKFNAAGRRASAWKEIWKTSTPNDTYLPGLQMFVGDNAGVIGIALSYWIFDAHSVRVRKTSAYFIEADIKTGAATGPPVSLPVHGDGSLSACTVSQPVWNGSNWLVPVSNYTYNSNGIGTKSAEAFIFTVGGEAPHSVVQVPLEVANDASASFGEMWLAAYPGSTTDRWLFIKKTTEIPAAKRRLDRDQHKFSLVRLNSEGRPVQTKTLVFAKLSHLLAYDPAYETYYERDGFSKIVASSASGTPKLFLSRLHTIDLWKRADPAAAHHYERQYLLYEINSKSGTVACKNKAVYINDGGVYERRPIIFVYQGGPLAVINGLRNESVMPYRSLSTLSVFPGLVE